jgi:hypothetical protein
MAETDETTQQDLVAWADELLTIPPSKHPLTSDRTSEQQVTEHMNRHGPGYYFYDYNGTLHFKPRWTVDNQGGPEKYFLPGYTKQWWCVNDMGVVGLAW